MPSIVDVRLCIASMRALRDLLRRTGQNREKASYIQGVQRVVEGIIHDIGIINAELASYAGLRHGATLTLELLANERGAEFVAVRQALARLIMLCPSNSHIAWEKRDGILVVTRTERNGFGKTTRVTLQT